MTSSPTSRLTPLVSPPSTNAARCGRSTSNTDVLPEAPSGLTAEMSGAGVQLQWDLHEGATKVAIERRMGADGKWDRIATQSAGVKFSEPRPPTSSVLCYRVRAINEAGESAYSNVIRVNP